MRIKSVVCILIGLIFISQFSSSVLMFAAEPLSKQSNFLVPTVTPQEVQVQASVPSMGTASSNRSSANIERPLSAATPLRLIQQEPLSKPSTSGTIASYRGTIKGINATPPLQVTSVSPGVDKRRESSRPQIASNAYHRGNL